MKALLNNGLLTGLMASMFNSLDAAPISTGPGPSRRDTRLRPIDPNQYAKTEGESRQVRRARERYIAKRSTGDRRNFL